MMRKKILILGAGPAGLTLARRLLRNPKIKFDVVLIEEKPYVGGLTASFEYEGLHFDFGSHRLHPATAPEILKDIRKLLGQELLDRPRNGRINLLGRFVKFPLNPLDLIMHLPLPFILGFSRDTLTKPVRRKHDPQKSFADVLLDGLGSTICETFYFPYARKLWGLNPEEISIVQAQRRVSANNIAKIVYKSLSLLPGIKREGTGRFYYPRKGFGQISQSLAQEVKLLGGKIRLSTTVEDICLKNNSLTSIVVSTSMNSQNGPKVNGKSNYEELTADFVFSTIPITTLTRILSSEPPAEVRDAYSDLEYRGMILHYIVLPMDRFTPYDAHYFPEEDVLFSRVSEPKNYSDQLEPRGLTGLCVEIPCKVGDTLWNASDDEITKRVIKELKHVQLPVESPIKDTFIRRLPKVYPIYDLNFESKFSIVDDYISQISGLISLGRQGLFVHDNTHHTMEMAYRASECLQPDLTWNSDIWQFYRKKFKDNVVED